MPCPVTTVPDVVIFPVACFMVGTGCFLYFLGSNNGRKHRAQQPMTDDAGCCCSTAAIVGYMYSTVP